MSKDSRNAVIPHHLAIIMDGNGRWARARGLPRVVGHQAGIRAVRRTVEACGELGIRILTLYTFSTENWQRPQAEVSSLMRLAEQCVAGELPELQRNGVRVQLMGRREGLPSSLLRTLDHAIEQTRGNDRLTLNLALNYGGRSEIVDAARAMLAAHQRGELDAAELDEETLARYLYCPNVPDADLIIRTGGEFRLSNFLLWRAVEAVFWSTPILWPDFQREHLLAAIQVYQEQSGGNHVRT
ncbi:MAG: di-trans,poly-cis-decaprenylcistransferase [Chloroflexi bacterium HGW-Chloroflexi-1]|nr:MAG: di-trans,poly-cis-decaprenylcistransferase [Chloroflexi bacterium HGW-Chloroflexi-1]